MIIIQAQHFLNDEGVKIFSSWIETLHETLKQFDGFSSLKRLESLNDPSTFVIQFQFDNKENLTKWIQSKKHSEVIGQIKKYHTEKVKCTFYNLLKEY